MISFEKFKYTYPMKITAACLFVTTQLIIIPSASGEVVNYSYDACGNRVAREIVVPAQENRDQQKKKNVPALFDIFAETNISFFPNPTDGILNVTFKSSERLDGNAQIVSAGGSILQSQPIEESMQFDLTDYPKGIYFLVISVDSDSQTYKIFRK